MIPRSTLLGIDEQIGIINAAWDGVRTVYGAGGVTLYRGKQIEVHARCTEFHL
ncbi:MAG: hypothetical protein WCA79_21045 [Anaerolineales bacterium]